MFVERVDCVRIFILCDKLFQISNFVIKNVVVLFLIDKIEFLAFNLFLKFVQIVVVGWRSLVGFQEVQHNVGVILHNGFFQILGVFVCAAAAWHIVHVGEVRKLRLS